MPTVTPLGIKRELCVCIHTKLPLETLYLFKEPIYNPLGSFKDVCIRTYIPLTLYLRRGSKGISNVPPRHPRFTKISY
jgi:hypothetical protein